MYIVALAVVVLVLAGAYRSLGGAGRRPAEPAALLTAAKDAVRASLAGHVEALAAAAGPHPSQPSDAIRDGRRSAAAAQQMLDMLPSAQEMSDRDAAVRALLAAAAEDSSWAWRMIAAGVTSPGVRIAVEALCGHAAECCAAADRLLLDAPAGEPVHRA